MHTSSIMSWILQGNHKIQHNAYVDEGFLQHEDACAEAVSGTEGISGKALK